MADNPIHAREGETVVIHWRTKDGKFFQARHTCPPAATREAVLQVDHGTHGRGCPHAAKVPLAYCSCGGKDQPEAQA